jgi:hypothetical protein
MTVQQVSAPRYGRRALIAVGLLLVALAVGSVTAVKLFPTKASEASLALPNRPALAAQGTDQAAVLERFRAEERGNSAQAARTQAAWSARLDGLATARVDQAWTARLDGLANARVDQAWTARLNGLAEQAGALEPAAPAPTPPR